MIKGSIYRETIAKAIVPALEHGAFSHVESPVTLYVMPTMFHFDKPINEPPLHTTTPTIFLHPGDFRRYLKEGEEALIAIVNRECFGLMRRGWVIQHDPRAIHKLRIDLERFRSRDAQLAILESLEELKGQRGSQNEIVILETYEQFAEIFGSPMDRRDKGDKGDDDDE